MMTVARSDAIAPLSHEVARFACDDLAPGALSQLATDFPLVVQPYSLVRASQRPLSPAARTVYETIRELAADALSSRGDFTTAGGDGLTLSQGTGGRGVQANEDDILVTEGLGKSFGDFKAVSDVALRVRRGSIHALIGPNGAGKTTCFNMLTKFIRRAPGGSSTTAATSPRWRRPTSPGSACVRSFQISAVFPHLTALENVRVALQRKRGDNFDFWRSKRASTNTTRAPANSWRRSA